MILLVNKLFAFLSVFFGSILSLMFKCCVFILLIGLGVGIFMPPTQNSDAANDSEYFIVSADETSPIVINADIEVAHKEDNNSYQMCERCKSLLAHHGIIMPRGICSDNIHAGNIIFTRHEFERIKDSLSVEKLDLPE